MHNQRRKKLLKTAIIVQYQLKLSVCPEGNGQNTAIVSRIVRLWCTSVFTKNTTAFAVKFVLMSIDFRGEFGYNCYCDKNVKDYNVKE